MQTLSYSKKSQKIILSYNQVLFCLDKPYFKPYLECIFENSKQEGIIISQNHKIGKQIYSLVRRREFPKNPQLRSDSVIISLPRTYKIEYYENKFLYLDTYSQAQINSYIDAHFHLEFHTFMLMKANDYGTRKEAILAFREGYNLSEDHILLSNLLKSDQRFRKKAGWIG